MTGDVVAGETYDGGGDTDTLEVTGSADFSLAGTVVTSIEALKLGSSATFRSNQLQAQGGLAAALAVTGTVGNVDTVTVKVDAAAAGSALTVDLANWTFAAWTHDPADNDRDRHRRLGGDERRECADAHRHASGTPSPAAQGTTRSPAVLVWM